MKVCDVSGATSPSYKTTRATRIVHVQPESVRTRPAIVNLLRPVEIKTITQPRVLDTWHQANDVISAASSSPYKFFWPFSVICLILFLFKFCLTLSPSNSTKKKPIRSEILILKCSCPLTDWHAFACENITVRSGAEERRF